MKRTFITGLLLSLVLAVSAWALEDVSTLLTFQSAATIDGDGSSFVVMRHNSLAIDVAITNTATVTFQGTVDGTNYRSLACSKMADATSSATATSSASYQCNVAGLHKVKAPISSCSSCTVTVSGRLSTAALGGGASGSGGSGGTQYDEDTAHASGDKLTMAGTVRRDTAASSAGTDGDNSTINTDSTGRVWTHVGVVDTVVPGTAATHLGKAEDAAHTSGDVGVQTLCVRRDTPTSLAGADNDYIPCTTDSLGGQWVAIDHMVQIIGAVAHDAVDAQPPVKVGAKAIAHGTNPTAVAAADVTDTYANRAGIPFVIGGHPNIVTLELAFTAAQTDTAVVTVSAGTKIVVTSAQATCANSNTVDVAFRLGFGTANTPTTTGVVLTHPGIAAGSGISRGDGSGIIGVGADDADLRVTAGVPTTGSCRVLVSYHTIES